MKARTAGHVYLLGNSGNPELFKVGYTTICPKKRALEVDRDGYGWLEGCRGWYLIGAQKSRNARAAEGHVHTVLSQYRLTEYSQRSGHTELFRLPRREVRKALSGGGAARSSLHRMGRAVFVSMGIILTLMVVFGE